MKKSWDVSLERLAGQTWAALVSHDLSFITCAWEGGGKKGRDRSDSHSQKSSLAAVEDAWQRRRGSRAASLSPCLSTPCRSWHPSPAHPH